jgi:hypothetical protein
MLERAWWIGMLTHVRRSWQQQGEGVRVGGGAGQLWLVQVMRCWTSIGFDGSMTSWCCFDLIV